MMIFHRRFYDVTPGSILLVSAVAELGDYLVYWCPCKDYIKD